MKLKSLLVLVAMFSMSSLFAQETAGELEYIKEVLGEEKKAVLASFLGDNADASFWKIYEEYEVERKDLGEQRIDLMHRYAGSYLTFDNEESYKLVKDSQKYRRSIDKLIQKYTEKVKKQNGYEVAAQFYQYENYILSVIRVAIMESLPFVGETN